MNKTKIIFKRATGLKHRQLIIASDSISKNLNNYREEVDSGKCTVKELVTDMITQSTFHGYKTFNKDNIEELKHRLSKELKYGGWNKTQTKTILGVVVTVLKRSQLLNMW